MTTELVELADLLAQGCCMTSGEVEQRIRALASRAGGWRTIDSAPKDGARFLALTESGYPVILSWVSEMKCFANNNWREFTNAELWQPIPAAPEPVGVGSSNSTNDEENV